MKIDDAYKRKIYGQWLRKTGRGYKRKPTALTVKAREYMKAKPYCGAFNRTDCSDRDPVGEKPIENIVNGGRENCLMVKIANKNKKDAYRRFIGRTGKGSTRMPNKDFDKRLLDIMHTKPYGGSVAKKSTVNEKTAPASEDNDTSVCNAESGDAVTSGGDDIDHGSDKTESPD